MAVPETTTTTTTTEKRCDDVSDSDMLTTTLHSGRLVDENDEDTSEAQAQVIASLRAQVTDLFSQVTQLNSKLVSSYDRVSDLEDQLHDTSSSLRNATVAISSLELERSHHLAALNTGLLVEKAHVTAELNRLMERATEEAAQRGQAETARQDIEKDLDDLSASLFDQANTMVAEARFSKAQSERKVQDAEQALKIAEDAVQDMQVQMQTLHAEKEAAEREAQEARLTVGKGKWVEHEDVRVGEVPRIRYMTTHTPYAEFVALVGHLRGMRTSQPSPPVMSTLLNQPFVARLLAEDSEPTIRLDLAPSLNWLSRRSVLAAIHSGMLTVEPLPFSTLVHELHQHPQLMSTPTLFCALCGSPIARIPPTTPVSRSHNVNGGSWFKYPLALGSTQSHNHNHHHHHNNAGTSPTAEYETPGQVYVFRLATPTTSPPPSALPTGHAPSASVPAFGSSSRPPLNVIASSRVLQAPTQHTPYPLCTSNYCLTRLRSTCSLWAFVRVGIVERIWEEDVVAPSKLLVNGNAPETALLPSAMTSGGRKPVGRTGTSLASERPPVPPRRRRLWEMASALGERAVSWGKETNENGREKEKETEMEMEKEDAKGLPTPPPSHPSVPHPHAESSSTAREVDVLDPPPLPRRNVVRDADTVVPTLGTQNGIGATEHKEPATNTNGHVDLDLNASSSSTSPAEDSTLAATSSSEAATPLPTTSYSVTAEPSTPPPSTSQDPSPPPPQPLSPHAIPLPTTPTTPNPISRVASPVPRPRSRLSSPASPPPSSRPGSPAIGRRPSPAPVPAPASAAGTSISRTASPSPGPGSGPGLGPGHPPSVSHVRGKPSMPSPLGPSSRPASPATVPGAGAPPLPRRAASRRIVPPPPTSGGAKAAEEGACGKDKEEGTSPGGAGPAVAPISEVPDAPQEGEVDAPAETETKRGDDDGGEGTGVVSDVNGVARAESEPAKEDVVAVATNGTSASAVPDKLPTHVVSQGTVSGNENGNENENGRRTSMDTTSTKRSSSTEGEGFASDATWEERTWKEVVRLKEDMFWARTGGVRAVVGRG